MKEKLKRLEHHMLIDGKYAQDDVLPQLRQSLEEIVPPHCYFQLDSILKQLEHELACYDVSDRYVEKEKTELEKRREAFGV